MFTGIDTTILNYDENGSGEITLVFLHYFGGSSKAWNGVINELKKSFRCIAVDLRGFGNSSSPVDELSVNDNAGDVTNLIHSLNLKNYILAGHSMGGKIALAVAAKKPAGLTSVILIAPSPPTPEPGSDEDRKKMLDTFGNRVAIEKLIKKITVKQIPERELGETIRDHLRVSDVAWNGWIENGSQEDISSLMTNIRVPVSVISGSGDPNFSTSFLRTEFIKYFPEADFYEIKEAGHLLPIEDPLSVANSIQNFILK